MRRGLAAAALGAMLAAAVLGGCTTPSATPPAATATGAADPPEGAFPLEPATHPHVQLKCPLEPAFHYDPGALPAEEVTAAFQCSSEPWTPAPDGTPQTVQHVDRIAQEQVATLLEAYALPDEERAAVDCDLVVRDPLIVWLHRGDSITAVRAPLDACGAPLDAAAEAYASVELHRVLVAREKEGTSTS